MTDFIEEQGPVQGWCQAIRLFATAARDAGPDLNRRTFVTAMSKITDFPGHQHPGPELRPGQALRAHRVPGGAAAHQLAGVHPVQAAQERHPPVHLLGQRPAVRPPAHRLTPGRRTGRVAGRDTSRRALVDKAGGSRPSRCRNSGTVGTPTAGACWRASSPADEVAAARPELGRSLPVGRGGRPPPGDAGDGRARRRWDAAKPVFPFESTALNRLCVHDALIDLAQDLLGTDQVRLYQGLASAKYSRATPTTSSSSTSTTATTPWWCPAPTSASSTSSSSST